ncbi:MAG: type II and III secretion system protein, partial [Candidatus Omnitrophica bacterium]|nr:type II and III secretion system protein [Candidatus Omnitrophota bacterium]
PSINKDGFVKMRIKPEVSTVSSWITTSSGNRIPVVDTSNVETEVMIKDGRTIVIAGLVKETASESKNKVPVLGDIPVLGEAFRNVSNDNQKKEVLIFFTPHIMGEEENIQNEKERIGNIEKKNNN